jgi:DNA helicase-2/ATP-dependent DNA helicase PcrA
MMTLHSAKGLEFPVVFIPGMEDGVFPSMATIVNPEEMTEERRLAYVGITRAKEQLYLIKSSSRMIFGQTSRNRISRFAEEIPPEILERTGDAHVAEVLQRAAASREKRVPKIVPMASSHLSSANKEVLGEYGVGQQVKHNIFGTGLVTKAEKMGGDTMLEIAFDKAGTKILMANFSKLKKL